jgi:hypothetical protein
MTTRTPEIKFPISKIGRASSGIVLIALVVALFALLPGVEIQAAPPGVGREPPGIVPPPGEFQPAIPPPGPVPPPGVETPAAPTSPPATMPEYSYQGKPISPAQFNGLFREFGQKTLFLDGKLIDLGEGIARENSGVRRGFTPPVTTEVPPIGSVRSGAGEVRSVETDSLIVYFEGFASNLDAGYVGLPAVTFRVRGINPKKFVEGAHVGFDRMIFLGTAKVGGRTLHEFIVGAQPPTAAQFADGLNSGMTLYRYTNTSKESVVLKPQADSPVRPDDKPTVKPEAPVSDNAEQRLSLAETYRSGGLTAKAKEILESVIKDFPDTPAVAKAKLALEGLRP